MNAAEAEATRYDGTVAVWFTSHSQIDARDWNNIEEFNGPHHPLAGYYKNDDPEVLRQQLRWMRRAGIDAIVYDVFAFNGWELTDLPEDKVLPMLADELSHQDDESRKLKLIIWLEKYAENPSLEQYRYALNYVRENFAEEDYYCRYRGRPFVVTYHNHRNDAIDEIEWENEYFTMGRIRPYYSDVWCYVGHYPQRLSREWMVASPGFDPYLELAYTAKHLRGEANPDLDKIFRESRGGAADREEGAYFEKQLLRARQGNPDFTFISGWNDWQYANQIEPAVEYGFQYVDQAARLLGREAETAPYRE